MKDLRVRTMLTIVFVALFVFSATGSALAAPGVAGDTIRVWVNYGAGRGAGVRQALVSANATFHYDFADLDAYVVTLPAAAVNGIQRNPNVLYVEEDAERYPIADMPSTAYLGALATADVSGQAVPYGIDMVQARDVWDKNLDGTVDEGAPTGDGRTVCIIDTGYSQAHEDLPNAIGGYSQVDDDWSRDGYGHGSHVGGTIAAENNGIGVVGVTPGTVGLYIVKIFNDRGKWTRSSDLVDALNRCKNNGANVVSMSLGGPTYVSNESSAFAAAYDGGMLSVAAAGNAGTTSYSYPASYSSVISVAAIDSSMALASFSQRNDQVELAAPGVSVLSTVPPDGYESWSGTSMATPHVSAVAALVWSANTQWTNAQIRAALQTTSRDLGVGGRDTSFGYGLVQAKAALDHLGGGVPPANTAPTVTINSPDQDSEFGSGASIAFGGIASDVEDGVLTADLAWTSSRDGEIGTGGSFDAMLSDGTHAITASATDAGGLTGSASVTVIVGTPVGLSIKVLSLDGSGAPLNKNFWQATVTATVEPALAGAVVGGTWSSGGSGTCTTNTMGQCSMTTNVRTKTYSSTTFAVLDVVLSGYTYDPSESEVTFEINL